VIADPLSGKAYLVISSPIIFVAAFTLEVLVTYCAFDSNEKPVGRIACS
jgi:hypothetical protein